MKLQNKTAIITGAAAGIKDILLSTIQKFERVAIDGGLSI
jgi:hypothetical protein